jgi:hypothetical protein
MKPETNKWLPKLLGISLLIMFALPTAHSKTKIEDIKIEKLEPYTLEGIITGTKLYCLPWGLGEYSPFTKLESILGLNSQVEPIDVAVVTAPYNNPEVLDNFYTIMRDRYAWMLPKHKDAVYPPKEHITNNHLLATNKEINRKIMRLKKGQQIVLKGHLVRITYPNGSVRTSSQSRSDEGYAPVWNRSTPGIAGGACEIMLVEAIKIKNAKEEELFEN